MSKLVTGDGRTHIESTLMRESLVDRRVIAKTSSENEFAIMPDVVMVGIGGQSIFDRGKGAVRPLVEELSALRATKKHKMVLSVGGGTRVRHTMSVALDLGLPLGGVAQLVGAMEECNAVFLNALLAKHGSIVMQREHFWELPLYLESGMLPIVISTPPYHFWEPPPAEGCLPMHGSDFGLFIHAEVLGARRIIFVKHIKHTTLDALMKNMPEELILDHALFTTWQRARHIKHVQIVNGLVPGQLTKALAGEPVGTVIVKE
jgi:molybdenum storage protein